jgi:hypothetical protein
LTETSRVIGTNAHNVFRVLADGWSYPSWVVGAAHMRDVDRSWPTVGARLHHRVGPWPINIDDQTVVTAMVPDRMLEMCARVWPLGTATVRVTLEPLDDGRTRVRMYEALSSSIGRKVPKLLQAALLVPRNREALARLDDIAVHRMAGG